MRIDEGGKYDAGQSSRLAIPAKTAKTFALRWPSTDGIITTNQWLHAGEEVTEFSRTPLFIPYL